MQNNQINNNSLYQATVNKVDNLLRTNTEWIRRYNDYINDLECRIKPLVNAATLRFGTAKNLDIYLPLSLAKKATKSSASFDIRVGGQSVATLIVKNSDVCICFNTKNNINYFKDYSIFPCHKRVSAKTKHATLSCIQDGDILSWHSPEAVAFRKYFAQCQVGKLRSLEHNYESQLLKQFSMKTSKGKILKNIQPVKLLGKRFQMPTPIQASQSGKKVINFANANGGGIDILARYGFGRKTSLTVFELKDECNKNEVPEKAIAQAIAYATFIRLLLRSSDTNADKWWSFFGFKRPIPKNGLQIKAVIAMPVGKYNDTSFAGIKLPLQTIGPYNNDHIELHYLYFNVDSSNVITGISSTSL